MDSDIKKSKSVLEKLLFPGLASVKFSQNVLGFHLFCLKVPKQMHLFLLYVLV